MSIQNHLYWIGVRESEINDTGELFVGSISVFGSNIGSNYSFDKEFAWRFDCNIDHDEWLDYVNEKVAEISSYDSECRFMLYYPADFHYYNENVRKRVIYLCDTNIIAFLENKIKSKLWLGEYVPIVPYYLMYGNDICEEVLRQKFPEYTSFVIQASSSCGGSGTWLLSSKTATIVMGYLNSNSQYMVTPYIERSISVNIHTVIYESEVVLLPASVQIITHDRASFSYSGADFITFQHLPSSTKEKIYQYADIICEKLRENGYRGVAGIDFIATADEVYFMEINSRFQASTILINKVLNALSSPFSVQHLHKNAFEKAQCSYEIPNINVNYSFFCYSYHHKEEAKLKLLYNIKKEYASSIKCIDNYLDWSLKKDENTYLYEFLFEQNITALAPDFSCIIDPNVQLTSGIIDIARWKEQLLELKIMLMNQGIRISPSALNRLNLNGGLNYKEFYAIDMEFCNLYINVPFNMALTQLSPFLIILNDDDKYVLTYYGFSLGNVTIRKEDPQGEMYINNFKFNEITYLGVDRLRVFHRHSCFYKRHSKGCKFCDIETSDKHFPLSDVKSIIDTYIGHPMINHYLIGGGSDAPNSNFSRILELVTYINKKTGKPIYLMCTPPLDTNILYQLYDAGVTEITFNLEVFDRTIAQRIMPGKGELSLEVYDRNFKTAVKLWGKNCKVRSAFIVGLENKESLYAGIEYVCKIGVSPILSLFKPILGTELEYMLPPSNSEILDICRHIQKICNKYNIELGPSCSYCEDNTLKISSNQFIFPK